MTNINERQCLVCGCSPHVYRHHGGSHEFVPPPSPPPVEGETERRVIAVVHHRADAPPAVFEVVSDQPEETDTMNDESAHAPLRPPFLDAALILLRRRGFHTTADEVVRVWELNDGEDQPSPAVGAEVRVEWGVRWHSDRRNVTGWRWHDHEEQRDQMLAQRQRMGYDVQTAQRTTTTSAWQPVTDEEGQA